MDWAESNGAGDTKERLFGTNEAAGEHDLPAAE